MNDHHSSSHVLFSFLQVSVMQEELTALQPELIQTSAETDKMMVKIEGETVEVDAKKELVSADEKVANEAAAAAQLIKVFRVFLCHIMPINRSITNITTAFFNFNFRILTFNLRILTQISNVLPLISEFRYRFMAAEALCSSLTY